jgi:hypothetical protein
MIGQIIIFIVGLVVGFIVGKFWKSRKMSETVGVIKSIDPKAADPKAIVDQLKKIWHIGE